MFSGKIFGVGLNKTGTTSLTAACEILGFSAMHHEIAGRPSDEISALAAKNVEHGRDPLAGIPDVGGHEAFFDVRAVERYFRQFDQHHPDSRFILHLRDLDSWLDSREKHVRRMAAAADAGLTDSRWVTIERDRWAAEWHEHVCEVRTHFMGREGDLLEIDVVGGDGWETLAPFLERSVPAVPFPHQNRAQPLWAQKTRQAGVRVKRSIERACGGWRSSGLT